MRYYRAALAAAAQGDISSAVYFVRCSMLLNEDAPNAARLLNLLEQQNTIEAETLNRLRVLINARKYRKALKIELPKTSKAHTVRGLLFAQLKQYRSAKEELTAALLLNSGNNIAKQALIHCSQKRRRLFK